MAYEYDKARTNSYVSSKYGVKTNAARSGGGNSGGGGQMRSARADSAAARARVLPGKNSRPAKEKRSAMDELMDFVNGMGSMVGGSGGSGGSAGNGAQIAAMVAALNKNKDAATSRYQTNKNQVTDLYGQLRDELKPNAGMTAARYNTSIDQSKTGGQQIAQIANQRQNEQAATTNAGLASLGIDAPGTTAGSDTATNRGLVDLASNNATWGNLQGVLSNAQQSRDQLDVQGATDAGIIANRQLTGSYEDYLRQIDGEIANAQASYVGPSGGSGGSPARYSNPMLDMVNEGILGNMMGAAGLGKQEKPAPDRGNVAALLGAYGSGTNQYGKALSQSEVISNLQKSKDPQGAYQAYLFQQGRIK